MTKFKVGDKVRILRCWPNKYIGTVGIVTKCETFTIDVIAFDNEELAFNAESSLELINSSPIRTVTKREIVDGTFSNLNIYHVNNCTYKNDLRIEMNTSRHTVAELKSMIKTLSEIVEVLEENDA